jgi:hypothetical protein
MIDQNSKNDGSKARQGEGRRRVQAAQKPATRRMIDQNSKK